MHKRKIINFNMIGMVGVSVLSLLAIAMLCPVVSETTSALTCDEGLSEDECLAQNATTTTATMSLDAAVASVISIGLQNELTIDITPKSTGPELTRGIASLVVDTNNDSGYAVYMSTASGTNLVSTDHATEDIKITSITNEGAIGANEWGYAITGQNEGKTVTEFNPIPAASTEIKSTDAADTRGLDIYDLVFGVAVDTNIPAGLYSGSVVVSAVANPIEVSNLRQLVFMQDMTSEICGNTAYDMSGNTDPTTADPMNPVTKQLVDTRDGKRYWVAKLRDGNCWMTQNLALDLSIDKTLTPADTNVASNYTSTATTRVDNTATTTTNKISPAFSGSGTVNKDLSAQYSWGMWQNTVLSTPEFVRTCVGHGYENAAISSDILAQVCSGEGFIDTLGWQSTYTAQQGKIHLEAGNDTDKKSSDPKYPYEYEGLVAADVMNHTYDAHYLVGNYYTWSAAVAGSFTSNSIYTKSSICPKGWTLPRDSSNTGVGGDTRSGTFGNLLKAYGLKPTISSVATTNTVTLRDYSSKLDYINVVDGSTVDYTIFDNQFNIAAYPLSFIRSGYINLFNLKESGVGHYWMRNLSASDNGSANNLFINQSTSVGSSSYYREYGFPVRCLAE